jgi:hypothetical protein
MRFGIAAALALIAATSLNAQTAPDLGTATPIQGNWTYAASADGSDAIFANALGASQLWVHCTRATRRVTIGKAAAAVAPFVNVWTSSQTRSVASSFNPATGGLTMDFTNYDPLLDAIATSRGRIGFSAGSEPPLVVPAWAEAAHVIEDCRA